MIGEVFVHIVENALRDPTGFLTCESLRREIVPVFELRNDPTSDFSFLVVTTIMDTDTEQCPEE